MKSITEIIKEVVLQSTTKKVEIDDSRFFAVLLEEGNGRKLWNFVGLFVTVIICFTILITSFLFFINDVLLFQNTPKINEYGTIMPERSCKRETAIFLFGSAQRWANTGIQLQKGDEIKISYSGGFNSDIAGLKQAIEKNNMPRYAWISFSKLEIENKIENRKKLLYSSEKDAKFGSLLYVIAGEMGVDDNIDTDITQVEQNTSTDIKQNGILYLAVNDIYLTPKVVKQYQEENKKIFQDSIITQTQFNSIKENNNVDLFFYNAKDSVYYVCGNKFEKLAQENRDLFYNDNLGEVLVVIDIKRNISPRHWQTVLYRWTEENIILSVLVYFSCFSLILGIIMFRRKFYQFTKNYFKKLKDKKMN